MSLYRTWRPKSFTDLVGQDAVVRTLRTALTSGKLAHAYLFSGPRGSGKTSAAKILARCINCVAGPTPTPDNTCENCQAMLAGNALDVIEVDAASNRGIEEIRALRESVKFAPASMRMKVFIIDEAHMLTREGANAFLKTLEEPPPHAIFILATTAPEALPPTILSRCQRYAFRRIPIPVMIERMREIATAEGIAIDDGALGAIAYRADGGLRDALTMLEQVASYAGGAVDAATVDAAFGATGRQYARALVDAVLAADARSALRIVDEASDAGADMLGLVRGAIGEYRNLLVARIDRDLLARDLSVADAEAVVVLAGATPQPRVVRGLRLLADALAAGRSSGNPRLELETAVLRLIVQGEDPSLEALATRVALLESGIAPQPITVARNVSEPGPVATAPAIAPATSIPSRAPVSASAMVGESAAIAPATSAPAHAPAPEIVGESAATAPAISAPAHAPAPVVEAESAASAASVSAPVAARLQRDTRTPVAPREHLEPFARESEATREANLPGTSALVARAPISSEVERASGASEDDTGADPSDAVVPLASAREPQPPEPTSAEAAPPPLLRIVPPPVEIAPPVESAPPAAGAMPSLQQVRSQWDQIRLRAEEKHKPLRALLSRATVDSVDGNALVIGVGDGIQEGLARDKTQVIEGAVHEVLRVALRVVIRVRGSTPAGARATEPRAARADVEVRAVGANGEIDLLAYARKKLGGTENS